MASSSSSSSSSSSVGGASSTSKNNVNEQLIPSPDAIGTTHDQLIRFLKLYADTIWEVQQMRQLDTENVSTRVERRRTQHTQKSSAYISMKTAHHRRLKKKLPVKQGDNMHYYTTPSNSCSLVDLLSMNICVYVILLMLFRFLLQINKLGTRLQQEWKKLQTAIASIPDYQDMVGDDQ